MSRLPFHDMLGNHVLLGDYIFRPTIRAYEKVIEVKPYNPHLGPFRKFGTYQLLCQSIYAPNFPAHPKSWIKDGKNIMKINMTPEIESALVVMDGDWSHFQPKLILDFQK